MSNAIILDENKFLKLIKNKSKFNLIIENRKLLGYKMYGIKNHAEFINYHNPHDNCLWDAIIPGYSKNLPFNKNYLSKKIIGVLWLSDGNHKIFVTLYTKKYGFNENLIEKHIKLFIKNYTKINNHLSFKWIKF